MEEHQPPNDSANEMKLWPLWCWVSFLILIIAGLLALFIYAAFFTPASPVSIFRKIFGYALILSIMFFFGLAAWGAAKQTRYGLYLAIALLSCIVFSSLHTFVSKMLESSPLVANADWFERLNLLLTPIWQLYLSLWIWGGLLSYFITHQSKFGSRNQKRPR